MLDYKSLKARQRQIREGFPESLSLRVHRALSWLDRAEREAEDQDARFIFLWISFNAAYANEIPDRQMITERKLFMGFLDRLIESDEKKLLYRLVWDKFSGPIRLLIDNQYVFQPFWDFRNGQSSEAQWRKAFQYSRAAATRALGRMDTTRVLAVMFERLYVLRNQILHGGATWNSAINRGQVTQGAAIMGLIVPTVIHLMMEHPNQPWGDPCYPVVE
jgi:Apea-like HEPN